MKPAGVGPGAKIQRPFRSTPTAWPIETRSWQGGSSGGPGSRGVSQLFGSALISGIDRLFRDGAIGVVGARRAGRGVEPVQLVLRGLLAPAGADAAGERDGAPNRTDDFVIAVGDADQRFRFLVTALVFPVEDAAHPRARSLDL